MKNRQAHGDIRPQVLASLRRSVAEGLREQEVESWYLITLCRFNFVFFLQQFAVSERPQKPGQGSRPHDRDRS